MDHRERVLAALNHREPDRVPLDLGSTRNTGILVEAYQALEEYLGLGDGRMHRDDFGQSRIAGLATPSERVLERLGVDFRGLFLGKPDQSMESVFPDGSHRDEIGVVRQRPPNSHYYDIVHSPFNHDGVSPDDVANWAWPDPEDTGYVRGLRERALALRQDTDCAVVLHLQDVIVHPSQYMLGFERWYLNLILAPDLMHALLEKLCEIRTRLAVASLREVGDLIDVVSSSDDVADQRGPQVSPDMYRRFIKPRHNVYFETIRAHTNAKILYHSCGAVKKLIPEFIDLGIDFLNPVQVNSAGMDTAELKKEFGRDIGFWGAVDTSRVLPLGTPEEVKAEVARRVRDLGSGGGFVLAAVHNIQPDVPPENIVAMCDAVREIGAKIRG